MKRGYHYVSNHCKNRRHDVWNGKHFDLEPHKIYVGMKCLEDHEKRLAEIAQSFSGCEIYKMQQTNNGLEFKLVELQLA